MTVNEMAENMITEIKTRQSMYKGVDEENACWILDEYNAMFGENINPAEISDFP